MAQRVGSPVPSTWKDFAERQGWVAAAIGDGPRQERDAAFEQIVTAIENLVATGVGEASADAGIQADLEDDHRWRFVSDLKLAWDPGLPVWQPGGATQAERFDTSDPLGDKRIPLSLDSRLSLRALIAELRQLWPKLLDRELVRRTRLLGDRTLGLLHFVCLKAPIDASSRDPVQAILDMTNGGVDYSFEAIGLKVAAEQAYECIRPGGTATVIGMIPVGEKVEIEGRTLLREKKLQGSSMGSNRFRIDMPKYIDFYLQGRLLLDEMITRRGKLEDVNEAFRAMKAGEVARTVLMFD
ncbi:MAG: zinc-binding dehydrogenase [Chloroflexi bacterium]|nr:zinc-binding dehydrogenase [Chloroflexota bacterium]